MMKMRKSFCCSLRCFKALWIPLKVNSFYSSLSSLPFASLFHFVCHLPQKNFLFFFFSWSVQSWITEWWNVRLKKTKKKIQLSSEKIWKKNSLNQMKASCTEAPVKRWVKRLKVLREVHMWHQRQESETIEDKKDWKGSKVSCEFTQMLSVVQVDRHSDQKSFLLTINGWEFGSIIASVIVHFAFRSFIFSSHSLPSLIFFVSRGIFENLSSIKEGMKVDRKSFSSLILSLCELEDNGNVLQVILPR